MRPRKIETPLPSRGIDRSTDALLDLGGHSSQQRREDRGDLGEGEIGILKNGEKILEHRGHDRLVVVAVQDVIQDIQAAVETLVRVVADHIGWAHRGQKTLENSFASHASREQGRQE